MAKSFHAVSVVARREFACNAVDQIVGVRFLSDRAPTVPLMGCPHPKSCRCVYRHHQDRREDFRRDADSGLAGRPYYASERRTSPGRRADDARRTRSPR